MLIDPTMIHSGKDLAQTFLNISHSKMKIFNKCTVIPTIAIKIML